MNKWKSIKIADIAISVNAGGTPRRDKKEYWENGNIPWLKISDIKSKYISETEEFITEEGLRNSSAKLFPKGTLVFSIFASLGSMCILKKECTSNQAIAGIVPNKELIDTEYLYYCLKSENKKIISKKNHATQDNINLSILRNHEIPLPPIETQKKIVSILEKAERLKDMRKEADTLTDDFLKSLFLEMFGDPVRNAKKWEVVQAQELFHMKLGKMLSAKNYTGKNLRPYLRNVNVQWGYLDLSDIKEMDFDAKELDRYLLKGGDILVCEGGEVGRTAIYNGEIKDCCYQNALHRLRIKDDSINPHYFLYFMFFAVKYGLIQKDTIQVTIAHFTAEKFKKLNIVLPPIALQNRFAEIVQKVEAIKEKQEKSGKDIDDLFSSLMQRAFKGELV